MAIVTFGWAAHLLMARLASFVTKGFVNPELARSAFVAFCAVTTKLILMCFVVKSDRSFFVLEGHLFQLKFKIDLLIAKFDLGRLLGGGAYEPDSLIA